MVDLHALETVVLFDPIVICQRNWNLLDFNSRIHSIRLRAHFGAYLNH